MPTYNEALNLQHSVTELFAHNSGIDLLIVDDASPDGTGNLADEFAKQNDRIQVLHRSTKTGLADAYRDGFNWGIARGYELLIEMDADGSHRAIDLPKLIAAAATNDLVIGSRWVPGGRVENWPWYRLLLSRWGNTYARLMLGSAVSDLTAGFRVYRATLLNQLDFEHLGAHGYSFQVEMTRKSQLAKARIVEVPITFVEREFGVSKMSQGIVFEAIWLVTKLGLQRIFGAKN